ncbi:hypothetical protein PLESTB_000700100 [Pleodorina starrii]|uniref:Uncharacterized protein n=1 Tax=Pleodorina starrii TaxID=330485 RepID=A0A9W6F2B3_9CHLO|nr:hypothetical protein PLESTM_001216700 [Pleodorina starrii]GLC53026.1 hypothetical protein PLESTB_000700100 [Pleodorina starrii]GLC75026.1 hypothetical protein PLESTF_001585000 [Pleodorina starrii]
MAAVCGLGRRLLSCGRSPGPTIRRWERVVLCASVEDGTRVETTTPAASSFVEDQSLDSPSSSQRWLSGAESSVAGPSSNVVTALRANRGFKLIRSETRRLGQRRLAASVSVLALTTLAWYGQDLIAELGRRTSLPVEELDGLIYFVIGFVAVSCVLPKSRYSK